VSYQLVFLPSFRAKMRSQMEYIAKHGGAQAAVDTGDKIWNVISLLPNNPEIGRKGRVTGTREIVVAGTKFVLVWRIQPRKKVIQVLRVLHGSTITTPAPTVTVAMK
jgi:toxin ParE1/3/4